MTDGCDISSEITLRSTSLDLSDDKSILVQVMAWCHQATSHYLNQCWPRSLPPYDIARPQRVNNHSIDIVFPEYYGLSSRTVVKSHRFLKSFLYYIQVQLPWESNWWSVVIDFFKSINLRLFMMSVHQYKKQWYTYVDIIVVVNVPILMYIHYMQFQFLYNLWNCFTNDF